MDSECDTDGSWERKNVSILPATRHRPRTQSNSGVALVSYTLTAAVPSEVSSGQHTTVSHSFISLSKTEHGKQHKVSAHHEWMCLQAERHISLVSFSDFALKWLCTYMKSSSSYICTHTHTLMCFCVFSH